jgi:hypothetical protein
MKLSNPKLFKEYLPSHNVEGEKSKEVEKHNKNLHTKKEQIFMLWKVVERSASFETKI